MPEAGKSPDIPGDAPSSANPSAASCRRKWIEIAIVVLLTIVPAVRLGLLQISEGESDQDLWRFDYAFLAMEFALALLWILPAGVLILVAPEGLGNFGVRKLKWKADFGLGVVGTLLCLAAWYGLNPLFAKWGWQQQGNFMAPVEDVWEAIFCVLSTIISCFGQELSCRAHLQTRLSEALRPWIGIPVAVALFTSFHIYQGAAGVAHAAVFGLILALLFRFSKCVWPCIVAHTLWNLAVYLVP
ncbi:MAG: abortive infection [Planctomycetota bacterium]|nr:MAG: abortive infection [Planctomycetota bacterium]